MYHVKLVGSIKYQYHFFQLQNMNYVVKQIPKHSLKFGCTYKSNILRDLELSIGVEGIELFRNTMFESYMNIFKCNYQGQITKCYFF